MSDSVSSQECTPRLPNLTPVDDLVWHVLQKLVYEERRKHFANFKDLSINQSITFIIRQHGP